MRENIPCASAMRTASVPSTEATLTVNGYSGGIRWTFQSQRRHHRAFKQIENRGQQLRKLRRHRAGQRRSSPDRHLLNGGLFALANGTSNWTATVPLTPGTNTVRVRAVDLARQHRNQHASVGLRADHSARLELQRALLRHELAVARARGAFTMSVTAAARSRASCARAQNCISFAGRLVLADGEHHGAARGPKHAATRTRIHQRTGRKRE